LIIEFVKETSTHLREPMGKREFKNSHEDYKDRGGTWRSKS